MSEYSEKLKDPRWQKKRLEIFERDDWTCIICGDDKSTLNVHHTYYDYKLNPWEYKNIQLKTLCRRCHKNEHNYSSIEFALFVKEITKKGFLYYDIMSLLWVLNNFFITRKKFWLLLPKLTSFFKNTNKGNKKFIVRKSLK